MADVPLPKPKPRDAAEAARNGGGLKNGLAAGVDMLMGPMSGMPSVQGGDAGPSFADSSVAGYTLFNNPFSVSGQGGSSQTEGGASTQANPVAGISPNILLMAGIGVAAFFIARS